MKTLTTIVNGWSVVGEDSRKRVYDIAELIGHAKSIVKSVDSKKISHEAAYNQLTEILGVDR